MLDDGTLYSTRARADHLAHAGHGSPRHGPSDHHGAAATKAGYRANGAFREREQATPKRVALVKVSHVVTHDKPALLRNTFCWISS